MKDRKYFFLDIFSDNDLCGGSMYRRKNWPKSIVRSTT